ncbi:MAG: nickel pincer cofactor biosynthesis protein LarB [Planctomycetales bacterium]|nr:nickel pincer cofactor biosynthesis protein LarB [Planctomycetales bacterium]
MNDELKQLAERFLKGESTDAEFLAECLGSAASKTADATLDMDRQRRCGFPEVVFGEGKTAESLIEIFRAFAERGVIPLATRVADEKASRLCAEFDVIHNPVARTVRGNSGSSRNLAGKVAVVTAGTSDVPVAAEALETLAWMNIGTLAIDDVGVAGPHRLLAQVHQLQGCDAVIVVAGMEGALPSVVGGHVSCPVIAVPTSVGYGAAFGGIAALLGMLNSCAANVTVVNIDAGFKAAYVAGLIASRRNA